MRATALIVSVCCAVVITACGPIERQRLAEKCVRLQDVAIGMTKPQVIATKWGPPSSVDRLTSERGTTETWYYRTGPECSQSSDSTSISFNERGRVNYIHSVPYVPWRP